MKKAHLSPNDISAIKNKRRKSIPEEKCTQAYKIFDAKKKNLEVAIGLRLTDRADHRIQERVSEIGRIR